MSRRSTRASKGKSVDTAVNIFFKIIGGLFKLIFKALIMLGLWVPLLYAVFGIVLHYTLGFEPFDFSTFSTFYIVGGIVCIVIVVIISAYNLLINPIKRAFGKKQKTPTRQTSDLQPPLNEKPKKHSFFRQKKDVPSPAQTERARDYTDVQSLDWIPPQNQESPSEPAGEHPSIYFSTLKPDILVHEYHDRFELFRVDNNKLVPIGTEYK